MGVLYWDKIKSESIPSCYGKEWEETSTNPCGEIPLCPYDSCRLLSVNLYSFVENPFTDKSYFNYDKFKDVVYKAQRLMDDIVDLEEEKINLILKKIENDPESDEIKAVETNLWRKILRKLLDGRRTGLSAIGLADCFGSLNVQYDSTEGLLLAEKIYKQFAISAYKSSIDMAKERGTFPIYDCDKEKKNPFIQRMYDLLFPNTTIDYKLMQDSYGGKGFHRRNIAILTIPPSGTISLLGKISSGIEPIYQLYYKRRTKVTDDSKYDFVDQSGDKWKEYIVLHPKFKEWIISLYDTDNPLYWECYGLDVSKLYKFEDSPLIPTDINIINKFAEKSPYYKSTAYEIDPIQRVKLQATIGRFIDHSISSTINLPESVTEEEVSNIYMTAWKEGCKGITCYRNNCRTGVLINIDKKDTEFKQHDAPKRPKELITEFHKIKIKGTDYGVFIGLLNNKPYEVFAFSEPSIDEKFIVGKIIKENKGRYTFISPNYVVENLIKSAEAAEERTFTLMLSGLLRHGANPKFIIDWISKAELEITSFGTSISRVLKKYISDDTETKETCPDCKGKIIYKDGCKQCSQCGWSKCG